jgi:hypothetical protein
MTDTFPPDIIRLITTYLKPDDIANLGICSHELARKLLNGPYSEKLWRHYVAKVIAPKVPLIGIPVDFLNWKMLAFERNEKVVQNLLRMKHLEHRIKEPSSSKYFLQFYCRIDTTGVIQKRDLLGNVIPDETETVNLPSHVFKMDTSTFTSPSGDDDFKMTFYSVQSSKETHAFFWDGEGGYNSTTILYAVDRQCSPPTVMLCDKKGWTFKNHLLEGRAALGDTSDYFGNIHLVKNALNRTTAEIAGKLAHNDGQYFMNESQSRSYAYSDSHSSFRDLGNYSSNYRIGSNIVNRTHINEFIRVDEVIKIEANISLLFLYEAFCKQ